MSQKHLARIQGYMGRHWRRVSLFAVGVLSLVVIAVQLFLPWPSTPLYTVVDGVDVGGVPAAEAVKKLDEQYTKLPVQLYFGKSTKPYRQPMPKDIGLMVHSTPQVQAAEYAWWLRLVPTSLWWAHKLVSETAPTYQRDSAKLKAYVTKELGESCQVEAVNASLQYKDGRLQVVPAIDGGTCELAAVERTIAKATPTRANNQVRIAVTEHPAKLRDSEAKQFADTLTERVQNGVPIRAGNGTAMIPRTELLSWLDFTAPDDGIVATINPERSKKFFDDSVLGKVSVAPGTSHVKTLDFTEIERLNGANGQTLDSDTTLAMLNTWLAGEDIELVAATKVVPPKVNYTRTYSATDTGLSALIAQYAEAQPGSFGVSFAELDGKKRRATYQDNKVFRTASTYKLFVAYGTLKRIEAGQWQWSDPVHGGRDLAKCFDDMIVKSDNPCAETLLAKIGYSTMTKELRAIGLTKSSFLNSFPETTAGDLTIFVGSLQSGQLLSPSSTNTLLSAMKRNVYRQGIPAGASGQTADKVGFLDAFLHDSGVVYSPSGTYALSIMTEGSSWKAIAELTKKIEQLRSQG